MHEITEEDGKKFEELHCVNCGAPIGEYGDGSEGKIYCWRCNEPVAFLIKEGMKTVTKRAGSKARGAKK